MRSLNLAQNRYTFYGILRENWESILYLVAKKLVLALNVDGDLILNRVEGALPSTRKAIHDPPAKAEVVNKRARILATRKSETNASRNTICSGENTSQLDNFSGHRRSKRKLRQVLWKITR